MHYDIVYVCIGYKLNLLGFLNLGLKECSGNQALKDIILGLKWIRDNISNFGGHSNNKQFSYRVKAIVGSEDCLYNNIHICNIPSENDTLKPVIVNIHPGAYLNDSPDTWNSGSPDYIMHHDVVYVCIGYRLHILGFLNLGLEDCSGNQGLKDIVLGLKWIKNNVRSFGGDPMNITLLGASSGGALVHFLMLSPAAKGLFHKAIIMGMYAFNTVRVTREDNIHMAFKHAVAIGYQGKDVQDKKKLLSFLRKTAVDNLVIFESEKDKAAAFPCSPFSPTIDRGENAMIPISPRKLINLTARIPLIIGICDREAVTGFCRGVRKSMIDNFKNSFRQNCWGWAHNLHDDQLDAMYQKIKSFYLNGNKVIENAPLSTLVDIQTDAAFSEIYDTLINVIAIDLPSSVYVYKFLFDGDASSYKDVIVPLLEEPLEGTYHVTDYGYWARLWDKIVDDDSIRAKKTRNMIETFTKLFTTFAKIGDPNYKGLGVRWRSSTLQNPCYLSINDTLSLVEGKLNNERMIFWENLKQEYAQN